MKPAGRFHLLVTSSTIVIMYLFFAKILPTLQGWSNVNAMVGSIIAFLSSVGAYKSLATAFSWLLGRSKQVKAFVLGSEFVEGTWVGYFVGHAGDRRYVVETIEQDLDSIVIRGCSFTEDGNAHGSWNTDAVTLDAEKGTLMYAYSCDIHSRKSREQGLGVFHLERATKSHAPTGIRGYVADLVDGRRLEVVERRVTNEVLSFDRGLKEARRTFEKVDAI